MTTTKQQIVNAVAQIKTNMDLLDEELPHHCGNADPQQIYTELVKAEIAALVILAANL